MATVIRFQVRLGISGTGSLSVSHPVVNTAWLTETMGGGSVSASVIVNGWRAYLPLVMQGWPCPVTLTLQSPLSTDLTVTVNGAVTSTCSTVTRLERQWGDGESDDQWFPTVHTYAVSGTYPSTVTAVNNLGDIEMAHTICRWAFCPKQPTHPQTAGA